MRKKIMIYAASMALGSLMMLSCSSSDDEGFDEEKKLVNMVANVIPVKLTAEQRVFVNDNNGFSLNFLKQVNETDRSGKSFIYSPLSLTYVLGMVNDAAEGQTEEELEQTLGFHEGGLHAVNDYCKKLIDGLPYVDKDVELNIANAIFLNNKYKLKDQFQKDMQDFYDAKAEALDFKSNKTLGHINDWCKNKTKGMIPTILDEVNPDMVMFLLNAIYFKADWTHQFDPKQTKNETFTTEEGTTTMPMMHQNVLISYVKNDTYAGINIPYSNESWIMTVMLPEEGKTTDDVINYLADKGWPKDYQVDNPMSGATTYEVDLKLPRFETSSDTNNMDGGLIEVLKKMGINRAFDSQSAQFPNMCDKPVYISLMRQKAKIKVNEEGAEAAAVTVAGMYATSAGPVEILKADFHANRPFVYLIRESHSGAILFVGKFTGTV